MFRPIPADGQVELNERRYKIAILAPTCFYYQTALFQQLAKHQRLDLMVYFCSKEGLQGRDVRDMYKSDGEWGLSDELLEGYEHKFLRNFSPRPSYLKWPLGLINLGIVKAIAFRRPDAVILMSWMNPTWWMAIVACFLLRIPFFYMTDANVQIEPLRSVWKRRIKNFFLGKLIFRACAGFLCAGTANKQLYELYGVPENKLFPFAYSWGYDRLIEASKELKPKQQELRAELGIEDDAHVFLYCGRLSHEKNLFLLLDAFNQARDENSLLIFVGDGDQREELQNYARAQNIDSAKFFGFQDRNNVLKFYAVSDALCLLSRRETWGIVINEAMCFGLPVVVSHQVGAGIDLVLDGYNGYSVADADVGQLAKVLRRLAAQSSTERRILGNRSVQIIKNWSGRDLAQCLVDDIDSVRNR